MQSQTKRKLSVRLALAAAWLVASAAAFIAFGHLVQGHSLLLVAAVALIAKAGPFMALNALIEVVKPSTKTWLVVAIGGYVAFVLYYLVLVTIL